MYTKEKFFVYLCFRLKSQLDCAILQPKAVKVESKEAVKVKGDFLNEQ